MHLLANTYFLAIDPIAVNLVSIFKPILIFLTVLPYAWVISTVIEMDSRRRLLKPQLWASISITVLIVGLAAVLLIPWFWVGWPLMVLLFLATPYSYWKFRDARLPESQRFDLFAGKWAAMLATRKMNKAFSEVTASYQDSRGNKQTPPAKETPSFEIHINTERLLIPSLPARASRLELTPMGGAYVTVQTVDTIKSRRETYPSEAAVKMIDYLKSAAGLDIKERRKRQTAILKMKVGEGDMKFLLTTWGTTAGQILRIEHEREKQLSIPFEQLGMLPAQVQTLKDSIADVPGGVVLVLAPAGHGATTLAYGLLSRHNAYTSDIKTIERSVERLLEGIVQTPWIAGETTTDYAATLQTIVRRGPNVMMVSDIADPGTGPIFINPNSKETLFYIVMPTDSITAALGVYLKAVGDAKAGAGVLRAVVAGRLVRKLCPECRQEFQASPDQAKRLGGAPGKPLQLFRASGKIQVKNEIVECVNCQGTGFLSTMGVFEVIRPDDASRELLAIGKIADAYQQMRKAFRSPLAQECALFKVRGGETSLEEIARVFAPKVAAPVKPASGSTAVPATTTTNAPKKAAP